MTNVTKLLFNTPVAHADLTPLSAAELASLVFTVAIGSTSPVGDTVSTQHTVPNSNVSVGTVNPDGSKTVTVNFAELLPPFVPMDGVTYFADIFDSINAPGGVLNSTDSAVISFTNTSPPAPPTGFTVA